MTRLWTMCLALISLVISNPGASEEKPVSAGDRLNVIVAGETELSRVYIVDADGNLTVPLIGKVPVKQLQPAQVREELLHRLMRYVRNPQIVVEFAERARVAVSLTGAVRKTGALALKQGSRVSDAIAAAGGLLPEADARNAVLRRPGQAARTLPDLSKPLPDDAGMNPEIENGDVIDVPARTLHHVQVRGAVRKPGELTRGNRATLLEVLFAAGEVSADADVRHIQVLRKGAATPEVLDLRDVRSGAAPNVVLQDGDTVTVPLAARVLVKLLGGLRKPGEFQLQAGSSIRDAITTAGGFTDQADRRELILTSADGEVRKLTLDQLDGPDAGVRLQEGDQLFVPQQALRRFAVSGGVNTSGLFPFPANPAEKVYLTDALAAAKGLSERAARDKTVILVRRDPKGGEPEPRTIDLKAILQNKNPAANLEILPGDVIYVEREGPRRVDKSRVYERALRAMRVFTRGR